MVLIVAGMTAAPGQAQTQPAQPDASSTEAAATTTDTETKPTLKIELNRLEQTEKACRAYVVFQNETGREFRNFKLDLVMFGADGIIIRRLAVDAAPLRASKTLVKLFDIVGIECESIDRILVNDVLDCVDEEGPQTDCVDVVAPTSRASARLIL